ncbi:inositol monophosphatase family protein [Paeniglutamicibacter sulfureus]
MNPKHLQSAQGAAESPVDRAAALGRELLAVAREAAAAGAAVLAERGRGKVAADTKSAAGDWVTDFDRRAEIAVRDVIAAARPNDAITGEEYGRTVPAEPSGYRWSIDPLDGTANFVRGIVYYCTSVAVFGPLDEAAASATSATSATSAPSSTATPEGNTLAADGAAMDAGTHGWLAASINAPALGVEYYAAAGDGAWLIDSVLATGSDARRGGSATRAQRLQGGDKEEAGRLLATGFGYDADRRQFQVAALLGLMPGFANVRRIGSAALDLCLVADGTLDAYAEYGTQEFDWAAGALIAAEAGLPVLRPRTNPGWQAAGYLDFDALPAESSLGEVPAADQPASGAPAAK